MHLFISVKPRVGRTFALRAKYYFNVSHSGLVRLYKRAKGPVPLFVTLAPTLDYYVASYGPSYFFLRYFKSSFVTFCRLRFFPVIAEACCVVRVPEFGDITSMILGSLDAVDIRSDVAVRITTQ